MAEIGARAFSCAFAMSEFGQLVSPGVGRFRGTPRAICPRSVWEVHIASPSIFGLEEIAERIDDATAASVHDGLAVIREGRRGIVDRMSHDSYLHCSRVSISHQIRLQVDESCRAHVRRRGLTAEHEM